MRRPTHLCRSWLFVGGADAAALDDAARSGADVVIQELEDFTPPALRPRARAMAHGMYDAWRAHGRVAAVRINPLDGDGTDDLAAVMQGRPDVVALPKVADPDDMRALDAAVSRLERDLGIAHGSTRLLPNVETARGLVLTGAIATASARIEACLLASEDLAADLGAERGRDGVELAYARQRFLVECTAAGVVAVDCPYTWRDVEGLEADARWARRLGYRAKSCVATEHASLVNAALTPSRDELSRAQRIVDAFERARSAAEARAEVDGALIEVPIYTTARRLIERARELSAV